MTGWLLIAAAGLVSGALGAMGLGGGGILILCLTAFAGMEQVTAQGVNLLLFIPTALLALIPYFRKKLICTRALLPAIGAGLAGSLLGNAGIDWPAGSDWFRKRTEKHKVLKTAVIFSFDTVHL